MYTNYYHRIYHRNILYFLLLYLQSHKAEQILDLFKVPCIIVAWILHVQEIDMFSPLSVGEP